MEAGESPALAPILLVEDHVSFAQAVRVVFEGAGMGPVWLARTAGDALEKARSARFSLVVTDLELPDDSGQVVVDLCLEQGTPVVILSAYAKPDALVRWARVGVHGFLHKSVDLDRLLEVCAAARRGERAFDADQLLIGLGLAERSPEPTALSDRERGILELLGSGASTREIAEASYLSPETVRTYIKRILAKLGAHSRLEAVARARELGLLAGRHPHLGTPIDPS